MLHTTALSLCYCVQKTDDAGSSCLHGCVARCKEDPPTQSLQALGATPLISARLDLPALEVHNMQRACEVHHIPKHHEGHARLLFQLTRRAELYVAIAFRH